MTRNQYLALGIAGVITAFLLCLSLCSTAERSPQHSDGSKTDVRHPSQDPVPWLRSGKRVAVYGRGSVQRIEMLNDGDPRPAAGLEIRGEPLLTPDERTEVRALLNSWIPAADQQIQSHLETYDPDSVIDNRKWGNLVFNRALFRHAMAAIDERSYFIERSSRIHDFHGKTIIRVPLQRDGELVGVHVVFDRGTFQEVDEAEDFLYEQKRISRELAAYRFNSLSYDQRKAMVDRRETLLGSADRAPADRAFLLHNFPVGIALSRDRLLMHP